MATTTTKSVSKRNIKAAVPAGETSPAYILQRDEDSPTVVCIHAGGGGTMLAQASFSLEEEVASGTARWFDLGAATGTKTKYEVNKATAIRFTATTQPGVGEIAT